MGSKVTTHLSGGNVVIRGNGVVQADIRVADERISGIVDRGISVEADDHLLGHGGDISRLRLFTSFHAVGSRFATGSLHDVVGTGRFVPRRHPRTSSINS